MLSILDDFGLFFPCFDAVTVFLQVASHSQLPSVLDLCVFSFVAQTFFVSFCADKIAHICGAVALYPRRASDSVLSSCPCFSLQTFSSTQKEANTNTNQLVGTHGGVTHKHAPCSTKIFEKTICR